MNIGSIESGKIVIRVLTTNSVISTLLTDEKFNGKVIQPQTNGSKLVAEHGLAMSIELMDGNNKKVFLLDAGGPLKTIFPNLKALGLNFYDVDKLILSHGHIDHYGGFMGLLPELKEGTEIILSPNAYKQSIILIPKSMNYYSAQNITDNFRELQKQKVFSFNFKLPPLKKTMITKLVSEKNLDLIETIEPIKLTDGIITSGEIKLFEENEVTKGFYIIKNRKEYLKDTFRDEISIYINVKEKGLVVITDADIAELSIQLNTVKSLQE